MTFHSLVSSFAAKIAAFEHPLTDATRNSALELFGIAEQSAMPAPDVYYDDGWLILRWQIHQRYLTSCVLPNGHVYSQFADSEGILHDPAEFMTVAGSCPHPRAVQA